MTKTTSLTCTSKASKTSTVINCQDQSTPLIRMQDMITLLKGIQERSIPIGDDHPLIGRAYERLGSAALEKFLKNARVTHQDGQFLSFSLLVGTHGRKKAPFICVKNRFEDGLHLLIGGFNAHGN